METRIGSELSQSLNYALQNGQLSRQQVIDLLQKMSEDFTSADHDYICAVLFPESYPPARIPNRFPMPSAIFTQRFSFYVDTGVNGGGYISLLPHDTSFMAVYGHDLTQPWNGNIGNGMNSSCRYYNESDCRYIPQNYAQTRLVGASMRMQFLGVAASESGMISGAHVYESIIGQLSDEIIENGYFITRARPSEGMRVVYLPKDNADTEYDDADFRINDTDGTLNNIFQPVLEVAGESNLQVQSWQGTTFVDSGIAAAANRTIYPMQIWGQAAKKLQAMHPDQLVIAWTGLPSSQSKWFRVDIERHFEGIPRTTIRDIVGVAKAKPNPETIDLVKKFADVPLLFSQTMQQAPAIEKSVTSSLADTAWNLIKGVGGVAIQAGLTALTGPVGGAIGGSLAGMLLNGSNSNQVPIGGETMSNQPLSQGRYTAAATQQQTTTQNERIPITGFRMINNENSQPTSMLEPVNNGRGRYAFM